MSSAPAGSAYLPLRHCPMSKRRGAHYNAVRPDLPWSAKARGFERGFPYWVLDMVTQYQEQEPVPCCGAIRTSLRPA